MIIRSVQKDVRVDENHLTAPLHGIVKRVTIGNIHAVLAAVKSRKRSQFLFLCLTCLMEQKAQRRLDQLRHGLVVTGGFATKLRHHRIGDIERGLHMENHIRRMAICQRQPRAALLALRRKIDNNRLR